MSQFLHTNTEYMVLSVLLWSLSILVLYNGKAQKNLLTFSGISFVALSSFLIITNHYEANLGLIIGMICFLLGKLQYSYSKRIF